MSIGGDYSVGTQGLLKYRSKLPLAVWQAVVDLITLSPDTADTLRKYTSPPGNGMFLDHLSGFLSAFKVERCPPASNIMNPSQNVLLAHPFIKSPRLFCRFDDRSRNSQRETQASQNPTLQISSAILFTPCCDGHRANKGPINHTKRPDLDPASGARAFVSPWAHSFLLK